MATVSDQTCEHGVVGVCMVCFFLRKGEGKLEPKVPATGWCYYCNESYSIEHQNCGDRD